MTYSDIPLVSVLMTAYNREKYIAEAIESVLKSTYSHFELIVVDDCSTDNTVSIAKKYEHQDGRVSVYTNEQNLKQFGNRNKAALYAKGELLKYFDSDDVMYPDCLEVTVKAMLKFPEAGAGCEHKTKARELPVVYTPRECYINHYFNGNVLLFTGPTDCIFNTTVFKRLGGFRENMGILADTLLMLEIAALYSIVGFQTNLTYWRRHDEQVTVGQSDWSAMLRERYAINKIILNSASCPFTIEERRTVLRNIKSILARNLYRHLLYDGISEVREVYADTGFELKDILLGLLPNRKLSGK